MSSNTGPYRRPALKADLIQAVGVYKVTAGEALQLIEDGLRDASPDTRRVAVDSIGRFPKGVKARFTPADLTKSASARVNLLPVVITLTPSAPPPLYASQAQQFTATVTNAVNQAVTWTLTGAGTLSNAGLYTAPSSIATQQSVTVTATSQADNSKSASATITLYPPVSVTPAMSSSLAANRLPCLRKHASASASIRP